ncbi:MAG: hypothetical protein MUE41_00400 [Gemmatimonadaceae bacterium]|jgi:hypothetical protein|nr:hypothetical protein [Gemmatimonadaceae bacterium]
MTRHPFVRSAAIVGTLALAACNPFRSPFKQAPVVEVTTRDANVNARWSGTLASPANLAGAVQMRGSATMTPGSSSERTAVGIELANASPGGQHPWQLRRGLCGQDDGVVGAAELYRPLKVDDQGRAAADVSVPMIMPTEGRYHVSVAASVANPDVIVACANLAPPSR